MIIYSLFTCDHLLVGVLEQDMSPLGAIELRKGKGTLNLKGRFNIN